MENLAHDVENLAVDVRRTRPSTRRYEENLAVGRIPLLFDVVYDQNFAVFPIETSSTMRGGSTMRGQVDSARTARWSEDSSMMAMLVRRYDDASSTMREGSSTTRGQLDHARAARRSEGNLTTRGKSNQRGQLDDAGLV